MFNPFPCTAKQLLVANNHSITVGAATVSGYRSQNQDVILAIGELPSIQGACMCGVFDGHGDGDCVSLHCAHRLPIILGKYSELSIENIREACSVLDSEIEKTWYREQGSTGAFLVFEKAPGGAKHKVYVCNVGDSRCISYTAEKGPQLLTRDHSPDEPSEEFRIKQAGGFVSARRVCGQLGVSRSFGDWQYKEVGKEDNMVCSKPDITVVHTESTDDLFLIASDGLFERISVENLNEALGSLHARLQTSKGQALLQFCWDYCDEGLVEGSRDNISLLLIRTKGCFPATHQRYLSPGVQFEDIDEPRNKNHKATYLKSLGKLLSSSGLHNSLLPQDRNKVVRRRTERPVSREALQEALNEQRSKSPVRWPADVSSSSSSSSSRTTIVVPGTPLATKEVLYDDHHDDIYLPAW